MEYFRDSGKWGMHLLDERDEWGEAILISKKNLRRVGKIVRGSGSASREEMLENAYMQDLAKHL